VTRHLMHKLFFSLLMVVLLGACSGGGDSSADLTAGTPFDALLAVDPYIELAVFQEIDADTGAVLQESSPSDELGRFTFPQPLTPGSVVELADSDKGLHGGAPYQGMLRRVITDADEDPLVISPLTTLLANGVTPEELIAALNDAGLTNLAVADLYSDPMEGLSDMTEGVTEQDLKLLQASMAANAYMEITGTFQAGSNDLDDPDQFQIFSSMVNSMTSLLNPEEFEAIIATLSNDPDVATSPILEDFIFAVLAEQRTIVSLAKEGMESSGNFSPTLVEQAVQEAIQNGVANVKSYYSQRVPPSLTHDGVALYHDNCSSCHQPLDITEKPGKSAADIQAAINNNVGNMGYLSTLTPGEIAAIADVLQPASPAAPTAPNLSVPTDGAALYSSNCAGCHQPLDTTGKPGRSADQIQAAIDGNIGNMGYLSTLTPGEIAAIADALQPASPAAPTAPNPSVPTDGAALYSSNCAGCHQPLDTTGKPGRSADQIQAAIDGNIGNMGYLSTLTPDEVQAIADVLPNATNTGPDYSDCTLCHDQPPSGSSYPDTAGAHAIHTALASVGSDCSICHLGAAHNSEIDLGFPAAINAKSGQATDNMDGTCSSVKCHGGQTTPDWWDGSIVVETQCTACHTSGSSQYNSYSSGRHSKHVQDKGYGCTVCHNTVALSNGHFTNLQSSNFELNPASTVGGGSTRVGSYSNGTCSSITCHGDKRW
jgi:predicted CxxxxCH...CXXCH cytochrome family protein